MINYRAESACYSILRRVAPVLRHDVAGLMQPVRLLVTVLERRLMKPDFNLSAVQENIATIGQLTKQASAGFNNAIAWMSMDNDTPIDLSNAIDELLKLLAFELDSAALSVLNEIPKDKLNVSQRLLRTVLAGIVLAFCDEQIDQRQLRIVYIQNTNDKDQQSLDAGDLLLSLVEVEKIDSGVNEKAIGLDRLIDWDDVGALAQLFNLTVSRGPGWLRINVPNFALVL
jgi:hypothetical protein